MIGILAYGSLINHPDREIESAITDRKKVLTPFNVEFARYSEKTRGGAPTLVPVDSGGSKVKAEIFILKESISISEAESMLWRRETRRVGSKKTYSRPASPSPNSILVGKLSNFEGVDTILYTDFHSSGKISNPEPDELANRAIESLKKISNNKDGIQYLIDVKKSGIETALMSEYEKLILKKTSTDSLESAREKIIREKRNSI